MNRSWNTNERLRTDRTGCHLRFHTAWNQSIMNGFLFENSKQDDYN